MTLRPSLQALLGSALVTYAGASLLWSNADLLYSGLYLITLTLAGLVGCRLGSLRGVWFVCAVLAAVNALSFFVLRYGLGGNPNVSGCILALAFASALAHRFYWYLPIGAVGLWWIDSRTAQAAAFVVALLWLWQRARTAAYCIGILAASYLFYTAGSHGSGSMMQRLGIWQDTLNHLTLFGRGWGAFYNDYFAFYKHTNMTLIRAAHAYNDGLELIFEIGIFAILPLWLFLLAVEYQPTRWILLCYGILSLSFFPLYIPLVGHMVVLTAAYALRQTRSYPYGTLAPRSPALPQRS